MLVKLSLLIKSIIWFKLQELDEYENDEFVISAEKTHMELYLEQPKVDRNTNLNVLDFWKRNRFRYPELDAMACDILSILITTVASESVFSAGGRVLNKYRTSFLPENADTLIYARDLLYHVWGNGIPNIMHFQIFILIDHYFDFLYQFIW